MAPRRGKSLMSAVKAYAVIIALRLLSWLPLGVARALGRSLGRLLWRLNSQTRKVTEENLALCFPGWSAREREAVARQSLEGLGTTGAELGAVWHWPVPRLLAKIESVEGEALLQQALAGAAGLRSFELHCYGGDRNLFMTGFHRDP